MPATKWTEEAIRAEAAKYDSKGEFKRGNHSSYNAAHRLGLINDLFENKYRYWDEQSIRTEAAKYDNKKAFQIGNSGAHSAASKRFPDLLDDLFENKYRYWDEQSIRTEAAKYDSKKAFQLGNGSAYCITCRRFPDLLDEMFNNQRRYWDEQSIRTEAANYSSKSEFACGNSGAYGAASRLKLLDELFDNKYQYWDEPSLRTEAAKYDSKASFEREHSRAYNAARVRFPGLLDELFENQPRYTTADVFYIWQVDKCEWFGQPVFKFGITSLRLGMNRIKLCAKINRIKAVDIQLFKTDMAKMWEQLFHDVFTVVPDLGFVEGKTEFRACCPKTLQQMVGLILPIPNN